MKIHEPIPHWNIFTVPELKEILEHCRVLERLGIAQDEEMVGSIERDITLREKKIVSSYVPFESKRTRIKQITEKQSSSKSNKKQKPKDLLLIQNM